MSSGRIVNATPEIVRLAIFKSPVINPTLGTIAWLIGEPPPGGSQTIDIPDSFAVTAQVAHNPSEPGKVAPIVAGPEFSDLSAAFSIRAMSGTGPSGVALQLTAQMDGIVANQVRVLNECPQNVLSTVTAAGDALYAPQVIAPGGLFAEDLRDNFYVAVVTQFTRKGDRLIQEEISQARTALPPGGTITVTGSMWRGYSLTQS